MTTESIVKKNCFICNESQGSYMCGGCEQWFCFDHTVEHQKQMREQVDNIEKLHQVLSEDIKKEDRHLMLSNQVDTWEKETVTKIQDIAESLRNELKQLYEEPTKTLSAKMKKLSDELLLSRDKQDLTHERLDRWMEQIEEYRKIFQNSPKIELNEDKSSFISLIKIKFPSETKEPTVESCRSDVDHLHKHPIKTDTPTRPLENVNSITERHNSTTNMPSYPIATFCDSSKLDKQIEKLFEQLKCLPPMDKYGSMSGRCDHETEQMETFLHETFGFTNIVDREIVQGVKLFQINKYPHAMSPTKEIHFPSNDPNSFQMTVQEIIDWQKTYKVYADTNIKGMDKDFLSYALQGKSRDGEEAFRMKFVVRVSTCPILMEFDGKVISRKLNEDWPNKIKLVSVSGINFYGRAHDIGDILYYLSNWGDVFATDKHSGALLVNEQRDLMLKERRPRAKIHVNRVRDSLVRMARLRLMACDSEEVEIVVETGIRLGIFAGNQIGIDADIRALSAEAVRTVLEQDGPSYKNIRAVIFALPIFSTAECTEHIRDVYHDFVDEFDRSKYKGCIPVLIVDQDMHRLTVEIARQGYFVSEVNPVDSFGVFGNYWQNHQPTVAEKIALTTIGLLVQHHLINDQVVNEDNYELIKLDGTTKLDWSAHV